MKQIICDMRGVNYDEIPETWADSDARIYVENLMLKYQGKIIRVTITEVRGKLKLREKADKIEVAL